jgi:MFS family permease
MPQKDHLNFSPLKGENSCTSERFDVAPVQQSAHSPSWILFFLSASVGVSMIGLGIIWPLVPVYAVQLGAGGFQVGLIIASFNIARTFTNQPIGRLSDRWGRKPFILLGLFLYATISLLYVRATGVEALVFVRTFHGFTSVLVVPIAMALAADIAPKAQLGLYMGTLNMAVMLGLGLGPAIGGVIRDYLGMHAAFFTMGGLALLTFFGVAIFIPRSDSSGGLLSDQTTAPLKDLLRHRVVQGLFLLRVFMAAGQGSVYTFLPILALKINLSSSQVGIILMTNIFLIAILSRIFGGLADRFSPKHMIIIGTFISGLVVLGMPYASGFVMILMLNIIMGIGNGLAMPGGFVITGYLGRTMGMGSVMGFTETGWSLGMIAAPIIAGVVMDTLGVRSIFFAGGILTIVGTLVIALFLKGYTADRGDD